MLEMGKLKKWNTWAKRRWSEQKRSGCATKGHDVGFLPSWKCSVPCLYQCQYPGGDIIPSFERCYHWVETGYSMHGNSLYYFL